jgi:hypothetical protein
MQEHHLVVAFVNKMIFISIHNIINVQFVILTNAGAAK